MADTTRMVEILDRQIAVRELTEGQMMVLARYADTASTETVDTRQKIHAVARMLSILERAVVEDEDRRFLEDQMMDGKLELADMTAVVSVFKEEQPTNRAGRRASRTVKR